MEFATDECKNWWCWGEINYYGKGVNTISRIQFFPADYDAGPIGLIRLPWLDSRTTNPETEKE